MKRTTLTAAAVAAAALTLASCSNSEVGEEGLSPVNTTTEAGSENDPDTDTDTDTAEENQATGTTTVAAGGVNQTELDEWVKGVVGLGTTQTFSDADSVDGAPDWVSQIVAVTEDNGTLTFETSLADDADGTALADELAALYSEELNTNPPADWGKSITDIVVTTTDGAELTTKAV